METGIILEGFEELDKCDIRVSELVADGNLSVYYNLISKLSYGNIIKKIECINHIMKNYKKHLL